MKIIKKIKSQAAMEHLTIYVWVVVIILIVIGVLFALGAFNVDSPLSEKCVIETNSGLYCVDFTADDLNDITLIIRNSVGKDVEIESIEIRTGISDDEKTICRNSEGGMIRKGSSVNFIVGTDCNLQAGDRVRGSIEISYKRDQLTKTATGRLNSRVVAGEETAGCPEVGFAIEDSCLSESELMGNELSFIVSNNGEKTINSFLAKIYGSLSTKRITIDADLSLQEAKELSLRYDYNLIGDLEKVELSPVVIVNNELFSCSENVHEIEEFDSCELSELQREACNAAGQAGTCDTRLEEIGIIKKEECCLTLEVCCPQ